MATHRLILTDEQYQDYLNYITYPPNIQDVKKPNKKEYGETRHPTIKPLKMMSWLIKLLSNKNDIVLDPFAGSGTTLEAALSLSRIPIGIELTPDHVKTIKQRVPTADIREGNCIDVLKNIKNNSIDCIITDPPYAVAMADWDKFKTLKDFGNWCLQWGQECYRVLKPGGVIATFSAARTYHYMAMAMDNSGFTCRDMVEWVYWTTMPKGKNLKNCHEPIYIGLKGNIKDLTFNINSVRIPTTQKKQNLIIADRVKIPHTINAFEDLIIYD